MIVLFNPRATRPRNRRLPLSVLSIAAVLEGREDFRIVDGNLDPNPIETISGLIRSQAVELLGVTVMPGPQMVSAVQACREIRARFPRLPIVWGGYFASNYAVAALNAPYVDFAVRGQGEETFLELLDALRGRRSQESILGVSYKSRAGDIRHNPERAMRPLESFPALPYHRVPVAEYLLPTFLGRRTAVHQASLGCPYRCNFCGVVPFSGAREKMEPPARTETALRRLVETYRADAVQFYDNNFFLRESQARELAERLAPLALRWWCMARIDIVMGYSDATLDALRRAGCTMVFFGAESGSDATLKDMQKQLKAEETLALAERIRHFGIIPEFSFVVGSPQNPEGDARHCFEFIQKIKRLNPDAEIIIYPYTPVPQRDQKMYGGLNGDYEFPATPEEWATERWQRFIIRKDPETAWLEPSIRRLMRNFELVLSSRWPTVQDARLPVWGRRLLKALSAWRYRLKVYAFPFELKWAQRMIDLRKPKEESL
jgi:radical SAM superfamily enzyme YgiQ (UPF0313 family)